MMKLQNSITQIFTQIFQVLQGSADLEGYVGPFVKIQDFSCMTLLNFDPNSTTFLEIPEFFSIPDFTWLFHDCGN